MSYGNENDPFMRGEPNSRGYGPAGSTAHATGGYPAAGKGSVANSNLLPVLLVLLPWGVFFYVSCLFTYGYYHNAEFTWVSCGFIAAVSVTLVATSGRDPHRGEHLSAMGFLFLFALVFATLSGLWNYELHMGPYWAYDESREYTNVLPSEPAASFMDAGKLQFAAAAHVDTTESVGYKHGETYCVAPIKDPNTGSRVEFWAVCLNECGSRRDFRCDDAGDASARGAVTLTDHSQFMPGQYEYFKRAVKEAEASFDLVSASEPMFVRWLKDPDTYQKDMYDSGTGHFVLFLFVYFVFNLVFALQANYLLTRK